jgi:serine/threonine protein kinase
MAAWNPEANDIFLTALEFRGSEQREEYLDQACAGDATLRVQVQALLDASDRAGSFLDRPATGVPARVSETGPSIQEPADDDAALVEQAGAVIGRYKILQQIGEGGMGTVYLAEQTEPVQRKVALKIIKPGMDSRQVIARFEQERQALAIMDHPNIAKVLDAGTIANPKSEARNPKQIQSAKSQIQNEAAHNVPDIGASDLGFVSNFDIRASDFPVSGRPYFVMELVKGIPITEFCDSRNLTPHERLQLFLPVCHAVQHAHQKGIIHRDLKPSNVLVAMYDDKPVPKIIDFGVAKATGPKLTERTLFTQFGQLVGTLEYMSPEQAAFNALDIDTRSDIYSLGVLLYELLTGSTPFEKKRLQAAAIDEVLRIIREEEPPRPSTRLSTTEELPSIAANRGLEPKKLSGLLRGELDWIVMKCLEKDRDRRYETANGLAMDLKRYLCDEPVVACPPSATYRLRKFVRRNKGAVSAVMLVVAAFVAGITGTTLGMIRATAAEEEAKTQASKKEEARAEAVEQGNRARDAGTLAEQRLEQVTAEKQRVDAERAVQQAINDFWQLYLLGQIDVAERPGGLRTLLNKAVQKIDGTFVDRPLAEAAVRRTVGDAYRTLGRYEEARTQLSRSVDLLVAQLGTEHADTLTSKHLLAAVYQLQEEYERAEPLYREVLDSRIKLLGRDDVQTLTTMDNLGIVYGYLRQFERAEPLCREAQERRVALFGDNHPNTLTSNANLAGLYQLQGKYTLAEPLLQEVLKARSSVSGADHPETLSCMNNLAVLYASQGKYDQAEPLLQEVVQARGVRLGADHPDTLRSKADLALVYRHRGKYGEAEPLLNEVWQASIATRGRDHRATLNHARALAQGYLAQWKLDLAEPLVKETLEAQSDRFGPADTGTLASKTALAELYQLQKRYTQAESLCKEVAEAYTAKFGPDDAKTLTSKGNLAVVYLEQRRYGQAEPLLQEVVQARIARPGPDHPDTLRSRSQLAALYRLQTKYDRAEPLLQEVLQLQHVNPGARHPDTNNTRYELALLYKAQQKYDRAEPLFREAVDAARKTFGFMHWQTRWIARNASDNYEHMKELAKAEPLRRELVQTTKEKPGPQSAEYDVELVNLAVNLWGQQKHRQAENVLRDCLAIWQKKHPDDWITFGLESMLGGSLLGQKRFAEAETRLVHGYQGMKQREDKIPAAAKPRVTQALKHVVQLYEAWDKADQAAEWRAKLPAKDAGPKK